MVSNRRSYRSMRFKANRIIYDYGFYRPGGNRFLMDSHPDLIVSIYDKPDGFHAVVRRRNAEPGDSQLWTADYEMNKNSMATARRMFEDMTKQIDNVFGVHITWPYEPEPDQEQEPEMEPEPEIPEPEIVYNPIPLTFEPEPELEPEIPEQNHDEPPAPVVREYAAPGDDDIMTEYDIVPLDFEDIEDFEAPEPTPEPTPPLPPPPEDDDDDDDDDVDKFDDDDDDDYDYDDDFYEAPDAMDDIDMSLIARVQEREAQPLNAVVADFPHDEELHSLDRLGEATEDVESALMTNARNKSGQYPVEQRFDAVITRNILPIAVMGALAIGFLYFYRKHTMQAKQQAAAYYAAVYGGGADNYIPGL